MSATDLPNLDESWENLVRRMWELLPGARADGPAFRLVEMDRQILAGMLVGVVLDEQNLKRRHSGLLMLCPQLEDRVDLLTPDDCGLIARNGFPSISDILLLELFFAPTSWAILWVQVMRSKSLHWQSLGRMREMAKAKARQLNPNN